MKNRFQKIAPAIVVIALGIANMTAFALDEFYASQARPAEAAATTDTSFSNQDQATWKRVLVGICPLH
jgi:hypothetical protein